MEGFANVGTAAVEIVPIGNRHAAIAATEVVMIPVAALLAYLVQTALHHRLQHPLQRFLLAHPSTEYGMLASVTLAAHRNASQQDITPQMLFVGVLVVHLS